MKIVLLVVLCILSIGSILLVCLQKPKENGLGAGFSSGFGTSLRSQLQRNQDTKLVFATGIFGGLTLILSIVFMILH